MEPITSFLVSQAPGLATSKVFDLACNKFAAAFRTNVVERWSKKRAKVFFDQFCRSICEGSPDMTSQRLEELLDKIIDNEANSEALFDAYRRVCLSRSRDIGPRIVAMVIAAAVFEERVLTDGEEQVLLAAESLSDRELQECYEFVNENKPSPLAEALDQLGSVHRETLKVCWHRSQQESSRVDRAEASIAPLSLAVDIGLWAEKLSGFGLLRSDLTERQYAYEVDFDRHIDEPGTVKELAWWIEVSKEGMRLAELVGRVQGLVP
jgi:hypothetical protein